MTFFHGIQTSEPVDGVRPIFEKSTAIIGLVATATAGAGAATVALDAAFPINRPTLVTDVRAAIGAAGTGGTLAKALGAIADQGSPLVVVVRVTPGNDAAATTTAVVGGVTAGLYTGAQALLAAESQLGVRPRILGAPGLDTPDVVAAIAVIAKRLRGFQYFALRTVAGVLVADIAAATTARANYADREMMAIWPEATGWTGQAVATALGLRAMLDETIGWHQSLSNVPVEGVTGLTKDVHFNLRDATSDAGVLNAAQVTTLVSMTGYRFWGNRTCSSEPFFAFETATRTAQAIQDLIAESLAPFIDKPMTKGTVRDVVETINAGLRRWVRESRLIGGRAWFDASLNPPEVLSAGKLVLDYDYTPVAPLEGLSLNQRITTKYYAGFADALTA